MLPLSLPSGFLFVSASVIIDQVLCGATFSAEARRGRSACSSGLFSSLSGPEAPLPRSRLPEHPLPSAWQRSPLP